MAGTSSDTMKEKDGTDSAGAATHSAVRCLWISAAVILADQVTKWLIYTRVELAERLFVHPYLDITHRHNTGAAFSFLADQAGWQRWVFVGIATIVSVVIAVWLRRLPRRGQALLAIGLALILGGAIGNVIDRLHYGFVVDFILVHYNDWEFPAFNIADSAITLGAVLLILDSLFGRSER